MIRVEPGVTYSWPYRYHDPGQQRLKLAPEYGGDGRETGRCTDFPTGLVPAHSVPMTCCSIRPASFGQYRNGAFIAFHWL
ncbi:MAG: hypothetical protein U5P41_16255 [Gammaproteobacteria bacterium]|nr:hypothetical protein [Gammaproteobacteria bacterium]